MAKLYFYYASMNAGKSTTLLQADFNYRERGMRTLLFTAAIDLRAGAGVIGSRIGLEAPATMFDQDTDLEALIAAEQSAAPVGCVLVDEAQFLSARLLAIADALIEIKSVCLCGRKATMNLRVDEEGNAIREGAQTEIGGNERYIALCRKHFSERTGDAG